MKVNDPNVSIKEIADGINDLLPRINEANDAARKLLPDHTTVLFVFVEIGEDQVGLLGPTPVGLPYDHRKMIVSFLGGRMAEEPSATSEVTA